MKLAVIAELIEEAVKLPPPYQLSEICDQWYSPYYHLFYLVAKHNRGIAVETGVDQGRGCAAFVLGGCRVWGIDHTYKVGLDRFKAWHNFTFINKDSLPVPNEIHPLKIDFLHIDTEHSYSMAKAEFNEYKPYLNSEAVVFFDDLHAQNDGVLKFFSELPYQKIQDDRLHPQCGFGVLLYKED